MAPSNGRPRPPRDAAVVYAWLAREPDGTEGIAAAVMPSLGLTVQLVTLRERLARDEYGALAAAVAHHSGRPVRLVRFSRVTEMAIACPACGMVSQHPADAADGYCGNCHRRPGETVP